MGTVGPKEHKERKNVCGYICGQFEAYPQNKETVQLSTDDAQASAQEVLKLSAQRRADRIDLVAKFSTGCQSFADLRMSVHHGAVISAPDLLPDLGKGSVGHLPGKVHPDLTWMGDILGTTLPSEVAYGHVVVLSDSLKDSINRDLSHTFSDEVFEHFPCQIDRDLVVGQAGKGRDSDQ